ncbi:MAG: hypothetical protein AAF570_14420 [Bacteroidota bacterium]
MKKIRLSNPIDPKTLNANQLHALTDELYAIHARIFDNVDKAAFRKYVIEPPTYKTKIFRILNTSQDLVGYITFQVFSVKINGKENRIYRTEVGMLPAYRGNNLSLRTLFWESLKEFVRSGFKKSYFVATPVHPNAYCSAARQMRRLYPRPNQPLTQKSNGNMSKISKALGLQPSFNGSHWSQKVGWIVRNSPEQTQRIKNSDDPYVQFYLENNPGYAEGNGMLMVVPIAVDNGVWAVYNMLRKAFRRPKRHRRC